LRDMASQCGKQQRKASRYFQTSPNDACRTEHSSALVHSASRLAHCTTAAAATPTAPATTTAGAAAATAPWTPPKSPLNLVEETLFHSPHRLLVATILLNKQRATRMAPLMHRLFARWPTAKALAQAEVAELSELLRPLGLQHQRANRIVAMSAAWVACDGDVGDSASRLPGIGQYGADAFALFCTPNWRSVRPKDIELSKYVCWLREHLGEPTPSEGDAEGSAGERVP
jgi:methyl-CpG-binding domain protein 4